MAKFKAKKYHNHQSPIIKKNKLKQRTIELANFHKNIKMMMISQIKLKQSSIEFKILMLMMRINKKGSFISLQTLPKIRRLSNQSEKESKHRLPFQKKSLKIKTIPYRTLKDSIKQTFQSTRSYQIGQDHALLHNKTQTQTYLQQKFKAIKRRSQN